MLQKLVWETYTKSTPAERQSFIDEAERMIREYGWQDRTVMPWAGVQLNITKIINDLKDLDNMTNCSKSYMIALANGLADRMNSWEEYERMPKVQVRSLKSGRILAIDEWFANALIADGMAVRV